jgi:hypothetical protein
VFGKLLAIVLAVCFTAATLLVIRQQRLEIAHSVSEAHRRMTENEQTLWRLQAEIAARCRPDQVREMIHLLDGEWKPIPAAPTVPVRPEQPYVAGRDEPVEDLGG